MPTTPSAQPQADNQPDAIADALDAQKQATDDIKVVAEELGVVHAVLDNRIPEDVSHTDVGQAIARTDELEKRLNESVKVLEGVTDALEQEVKSRQATGGETAWIGLHRQHIVKELGPRGIAVNVVAPGAIETDFGGGAVRDNAQLSAFVAAHTALGRTGVPNDIHTMITSLLTRANR